MHTKLMDRRFVLGAGLGAAIGGTTVAALEFFDVIEIGALRVPTILRTLQQQVADDPSLHAVKAAASVALYSEGGACADNACTDQELLGLSSDDIVVLVRDDHAKGRVVSVLGWSLSRTEAQLLTLVQS